MSGDKEAVHLTLWTLDGRKRVPEALEGGVLGECLGELDHAGHILAAGEVVVVEAAAKAAQRSYGVLTLKHVWGQRGSAPDALERLIDLEHLGHVACTLWLKEVIVEAASTQSASLWGC